MVFYGIYCTLGMAFYPGSKAFQFAVKVAVPSGTLFLPVGVVPAAAFLLPGLLLPVAYLDFNGPGNALHCPAYVPGKVGAAFARHTGACGSLAAVLTFPLTSPDRGNPFNQDTLVGHGGYDFLGFYPVLAIALQGFGHSQAPAHGLGVFEYGFAYVVHQASGRIRVERVFHNCAQHKADETLGQLTGSLYQTWFMG
jgi:hypothetical protein